MNKGTIRAFGFFATGNHLVVTKGSKDVGAMHGAISPEFGLLNTQEVKRRHILLKSLLVGIVSGAVGSLFRLALIRIEFVRIALLAKIPAPWSVLTSIGLSAALGALAVWLVAKFCPEASGSGIPDLKSVLLGEREMRWKRLLPIKFLAGVAAIGGGMALGREGPTIQMGGACGLGVGTILRVKRGEGERKALISAGAGAGLAAAFNAPLAGVIFVIEELQGNFTPVIFAAAFLASVSSDVISRLMIGAAPVLSLRVLIAPSTSVLPFAVLLGIAAGFGGIAFNKGLLASLDFRARMKNIPSWGVGLIVGATIGLIGAYYPGVVGSGNAIVESAVAGTLAAGPLLVLLAARYGLTMFSYGSGAAGGIFAPLLVLGSIGGLWFGHVGHHVAPNWIQHPEVFAVLGMGALFTSIVRAPLTGIVLMVELTGEYGFMLPLLISCLTAYGVAEAIGNEPIYEALRMRALKKNEATQSIPLTAPER